MNTRNALRAIALASSCLAPLAGFAQTPPAAAGAPPTIVIAGTPFTGEFGLGLMGVMGRNPDLAGRYTGLNTTGVDLLGDFSLVGRAPWNSGSTRYYEFEGDNLVFQTGNRLGNGVGSGNGFAGATSNSIVNNGSLDIRAGDQGTWGIHGYYDAVTYTGNVIDSIYTVNGRTGYLNSPLVPWGGATATTAGTTYPSGAGLTTAAIANVARNLNSALLPVQTGTRRDIVGGDFKYIWNDWTITGAFRHEHKEGSLEESFYPGGFVPGAAFTLPVNYDTDRYDVTASYNSRVNQAVLQYTFSHFTDNNLFVSLPYPYSNAAKPFQETSAYSTPPSNSAHYVTVMLATNAVPYTRINLNARVGVEKQDNSFAPNTADPNPSGAGFSSLNPMLEGTKTTSPDITATVYQLRISATTHPFPNFDGRVYYGIDGRDVSLNTMSAYTGGTGGEAADALGAAASILIVPQDWLKQNAGADITYRLLPQYNTRLQLGYRLDATDRSNAQVGHSWTNTGSIGILSDFGSQLSGKLAFEYSSRSGNLTYLGPWVPLGQGVSYSGAYYQAPMTSEGVTARLDYQPNDKVSADFFVRFRNEDYSYPAASVANGGSPATAPLIGTGTGIKQDYRLSIGPDVDYRPLKNVDVHVFYTYDQIFYNNLGNGACSTSAAAPLCTGSVGYFQNKDTSSTHTIGVSGEWKVTEKLKLRGDYTLSYGSVMFTQFNGVFVANPTASYQNVTNYPDITSLMHSLRFTATYEVMPNVELVGQAAWFAFHNNDWNDTANAVQVYGATGTSILMTPGYSAPNWNVAMLMGGVRVKF